MEPQGSESIYQLVAVLQKLQVIKLTPTPACGQSTPTPEFSRPQYGIAVNYPENEYCRVVYTVINIFHVLAETKMKATSLKVVARNYAIIFIASLAFVMFSSQASAACSRDDVEFYLGKGFSTDQITALCSAASATGNDAPLSEMQNGDQPSATDAAGENEQFLKIAIKAKKIYLDSDSLHYTQKVCIEYGEEDLYGFTAKVCPDVKFTIAFEGLEVTHTGKKYGFYGRPEVRVKSTIKRDIIGGLKDKKPEDRELILESFEKGDKTAIPIRDDFSLERVKQVLQELSI